MRHIIAAIAAMLSLSMACIKVFDIIVFHVVYSVIERMHILFELVGRSFVQDMTSTLLIAAFVYSPLVFDTF